MPDTCPQCTGSFRCACVPTADHTGIATPCVLHAQWARATYGGFVPVATRPIAEAEVARLGRGKAATTR